ncbi:unnamed protein product [Vicia faba]|uniref:Uncharacterized protein n=1 Tax=Vicia faba TaxID=3906 RepID=A0AAV1AKX1_VICFA|nr:unnamed protein product [Vicia faba]
MSQVSNVLSTLSFLHTVLHELIPDLHINDENFTVQLDRCDEDAFCDRLLQNMHVVAMNASFVSHDRLLHPTNFKSRIARDLSLVRCYAFVFLHGQRFFIISGFSPSLT